MSDASGNNIAAQSYDDSGRQNHTVITDAKGKDAKATIYKTPDRVIPVIFLPGVMGSNLLGADNKRLWRLDSSGGAAWDWGMKGEEARKRLLHYKRTSVDDGGDIDKEDLKERLLFLSRKERKWGEVGYISYGEFLPWLQKVLNDHDEKQENQQTGNGKLTQREKLMNLNLNAEIGEANLTPSEVDLSYKYLFPVHAAGYNWLASNADSARSLNNRIDTIINDYNSRGMLCEKVILVTHSMGGLVARYNSENMKNSEKLLGIVHGVMPTRGSPTAYRRMKAGDASTAGIVLGNTGAKMTAVLAQSPGPLELLPGENYGNGWLQIEGLTGGLPKNGNPFTEIYKQRDSWWTLCEDRFLNPENHTKDKTALDSSWNEYKTLIDDVKDIIDGLDGKFHKNTYAFYGCGGKNSDEKYRNDFLSYGKVYWKAKSVVDKIAKDYGASNVSYIKNKDEDISELAFHGVIYDTQNLEIKNTRTVIMTSSSGIKKHPGIVYSILPPEDSGDGTVPVQGAKFTSGGLKSLFGVEVSHEGAYKKKGDNPTDDARLFTLRSIIKIAQEVKNTTLDYK
ncbi:PGAP1-like protein [Yersinia frederiksenii]|nr:PGAP1-like protein [Yersinia frederiksenii]CNI24229.1 PGAP1-like protein [Yersinia frederiksenii]